MPCAIMSLSTIKNTISPDKNGWFFRIALVVLVLVISLLYGAIHLFWLSDLDWNYQHAIFIGSFKTADSDHYLAQIKEVYEGNYLLSNAFLVEYKNTRALPLWPVFPYYFSAFIGKLLHIEVQYLAVLMDFMLPPLIFLLAYLFLDTVSSARSASLLGAFILTLVPHILQVPFKIGALFLQGTLSVWKFIAIVLRDAHGYSCFSRPINPQLTYIFLLAAFLFFFKGLTTSKHRYFVLAVLFGVMTSYSNVYFSTYLYVCLGIGAVFSLVLKDWSSFRSFALVLSSIVLFALPFWYVVFSFSGRELRQMALVIHSHAPIINAQFLFMLFLCILIAAAFRRGYLNQLTSLASFSLLMGGAICLNQHVITGMNVQPEGHYGEYVIPQAMILALSLLAAGWTRPHQRQRFSGIRWGRLISINTVMLSGGILLVILSLLLNPACIFAFLNPEGLFSSTPEFVALLKTLQFSGFGLGIFLLGIGILLKHQKKATASIHVKTILSAVVIIVLILDIAIVQYGRYQGELKPRFGYFQKLAPAIQWLNQHTEKESVILGSLNEYSTNTIISIYTHNNVYMSLHAQWYAVPPMDEIRDRIYNVIYFMGITSRADFQEALGKGEKIWIPAYSGVNFDEYQKKLERELYAELMKYRVDYLFYGPQEQEDFIIDPKSYPFLQEVYNDHVVKIYKIS